MDYEKSINYLESLPVAVANYNLNRLRRVLFLLGEPQKKYKIIHVAGTNGKGSTIALFDNVLRELKLYAGRYTSPHIFDYTERIAVDGCDVSREEFSVYINIIKEKYEKIEADYGKPPIFEVLTAVALYYFADKGVEWALVETGLGGLFDSTNVVLSVMSIITNVEFDHMDRCGYSIEEIAKHKAGIIKDGNLVVTAAEGEALSVIRKVAKQKDAQLHVYNQDFAVQRKPEGLQYNDSQVKFLYDIALLGHYQGINSALVIMGLQLLKEHYWNIGCAELQKAIVAGFMKTVWNGRFEIIKTTNNSTVIIDGAHNEAGASALRQALDEMFNGYGIIFIFGALKDKAVDKIVKRLWCDGDVVITVKVSSARALEAADAAKVWQRENEIRKGNCEIYAAEDIEQAIKKAEELLQLRKKEEMNMLICIAGSLYMVGDAKNILCVEAAAKL